jgi:zinc D-Ala-D-Ala carboxypeptidase
MRKIRLPKKLLVILPVLLVLAVGLWWFTRGADDKLEIPIINQLSNKRSEEEKPEEKTFDKSKHPIDKPGSIWFIANKTHPIGESYAPSDLVVPNIPIRPSAGWEEQQVRKVLVPDLEKMVADAKLSGVRLMLASGYRSYGLQAVIYQQNVNSLGQAEADRVSAKPGTSEHQTGLALDMEPSSRECEIEVCFGDLPEGKWLAEHAHEYGFIIRYTKDKESVTGYSFEPWHLRYVGRELSAEMKRTNVKTLEEFFEL